MTNTAEKSSGRTLEGRVLSNKMQKTIVVEITSLVKHAKYGKYFKRYRKFKAHDEKSECGVGDKVEVIESRPISKDKRFRVSRVLEKAKRLVGVQLDEGAL